tara:strand:- start:147 stop:296 length:150 start_codon:yes stop_codon:yes gene_type:complete
MTGVIICLLYKFFLYWLKSISEMDFKLWDLGIVTAADFSVQIELPKGLW